MFDISEIEKDSRRTWLDKLKKKDPVHAARFCDACTDYLGSTRKCDCEDS